MCCCIGPYHITRRYLLLYVAGVVPIYVVRAMQPAPPGMLPTTEVVELCAPFFSDSIAAEFEAYDIAGLLLVLVRVL